MGGFISFNNAKLPQKVMVVEDEILTRTSLEQVLEAYFDNVYYAEDGDEGLEMYFRVKPDIIFTDIVMPNMNGIDMLRQIVSLEDEDPLIVVFSAFDTTISESDLEMIGIFRKLVKPFKMKELEKLIEDIRQQDV